MIWVVPCLSKIWLSYEHEHSLKLLETFYPPPKLYLNKFPSFFPDYLKIYFGKSSSFTSKIITHSADFLILFVKTTKMVWKLLFLQTIFKYFPDFFFNYLLYEYYLWNKYYTHWRSVAVKTFSRDFLKRYLSYVEYSSQPVLRGRFSFCTNITLKKLLNGNKNCINENAQTGYRTLLYFIYFLRNIITPPLPKLTVTH